MFEGKPIHTYSDLIDHVSFNPKAAHEAIKSTGLPFNIKTAENMERVYEQMSYSYAPERKMKVIENEKNLEITTDQTPVSKSYKLDEDFLSMLQ